MEPARRLPPILAIWACALALPLAPRSSGCDLVFAVDSVAVGPDSLSLSISFRNATSETLWVESEPGDIRYALEYAGAAGVESREGIRFEGGAFASDPSAWTRAGAEAAAGLRLSPPGAVIRLAPLLLPREPGMGVGGVAVRFSGRTLFRAAEGGRLRPVGADTCLSVRSARSAGARGPGYASAR